MKPYKNVICQCVIAILTFVYFCFVTMRVFGCLRERLGENKKERERERKQRIRERERKNRPRELHKKTG